MLFHDELSDNGDSMLSAKLRVMPSGFFCLMRFFLRIDGVCFKMLDHRIYHKFGTNIVLREFQECFSTYEELREEKKLPYEKAKFSDQNLMSPLLKMKKMTTEKITF